MSRSSSWVVMKAWLGWLQRRADDVPGSTTRYDHNMRLDERSRLKSIGNENDFQIVCGNMYSAIFMMNSSGYGEHVRRIS